MPAMTLVGRASPGGPVDDVILQSGHWARRPGQVVLSSGDVYLNGNISPGTGLGAQLTRNRRAGEAHADRRRHRHLGKRLCGRLGGARRDRQRCARPGPRPARRCCTASARGHRGRHPRRHRRNDRGAAGRRGRCHPVLPDGPGAGGVGDRRHLAVRGRLRRHRPGDVSADRDQRGQRRGRGRLPEDRHPQEHRLHPRPGRGGLYRPGHGPGRGRLPGRGGAREPDGRAAARQDRQRLRGRDPWACRPGWTRPWRRRCAAGRHRRAAARAAGGPAERGGGDRRGPRARPGPRLCRAPAAGPAAAAPAGDDRARGARSPARRARRSRWPPSCSARPR